MKSRSTLRVASLSFLLAVGVGIPAATAAPTRATVKTAHNSKFGTLLVSSNGLTLYQLGTEKKGTIKCTGACATAWPPLLITGGAKPKAGPGVAQAELGTIKRLDHGTQVTYNGKALYRFGSDTTAGAVNGQNVAGFHVVVLGASPASTPAPAATTPVAGAVPAPTATTPTPGGAPAPAAPTPAAGGGYGGY